MSTISFIEIIKAAIIGLVEGVTEWLPVSSTGHMILVDEFVKLDVTPEFWNMFLVVIQLGAILAVVVLYFNELNPLAPSLDTPRRKAIWSRWGKIIVGVIPAAAIGLPLNDWMEAHLMNSWVVAVALILYGVIFIIVENWRGRKIAAEANNIEGAHFAVDTEALADPGTIRTMEQLNYKNAFLIGCFQVLSLVPGTSRSGSTIIGGLLLGTSRTLAAEFSFYMAIPVMFGASLLKVGNFIAEGNILVGSEIAIMVTGLLVAFITSILSIRFLMSFIRTNDFKPFGWYRIILGTIVIGYFLLVA